MDLARQKRRLVWALGLTGLAALVAAGGIVGSAMTHQRWLITLAAMAIAGGVAAQIWFIVGAMRDK
jgi:hypothetical protein